MCGGVGEVSVFIIMVLKLINCKGFYVCSEGPLNLSVGSLNVQLLR